jgi:DNA-directed RNA polymerase specialized sigma24 family protein
MSEPSLLRDLIRKAKGGDLHSFEDLVILHEALVLRVAQRLLLNREDAQDAAQEVFLRLQRDLKHFQQERDFAPWL